MAAALLIASTIVAVACINKRSVADAGKGFAVIELFTSEGCSSCPPADALVAKIQKESSGQPIYILAFHVDYWDRLGWKDMFSSAAFTHRQNQYAKWLHVSEIYTPQAVVNGQKEFVGSEEGTLRSAIKTNLQKQAAAQLSLSDIKLGKDKATLQYQTQGNTAGTVLVLALVQKSAQTKVERGENSGRMLSHVQIVRGLESFPLKADKGVASITLPKGFDPKAFELIAILQNTATGAISAAAKALF